jgi:hypothetical protein
MSILTKNEKETIIEAFQNSDYEGSDIEAVFEIFYRRMWTLDIEFARDFDTFISSLQPKLHYQQKTDKILGHETNEPMSQEEENDQS